MIYKGKSRMDNSETRVTSTKGRVRSRLLKGTDKSRMDNPETRVTSTRGRVRGRVSKRTDNTMVKLRTNSDLQGQITNGQSRDIGNINTRHRTRQTKTKTQYRNIRRSTTPTKPYNFFK